MNKNLLFIFLLGLIHVGCFEDTDSVITNNNPFDEDFTHPLVSVISINLIEFSSTYSYVEAKVKPDPFAIERLNDMYWVNPELTFLTLGDPNVYAERPEHLKLANLNTDTVYTLTTFPSDASIDSVKICTTIRYRFFNDLDFSLNPFDDTFVDTKIQQICY